MDTLVEERLMGAAQSRAAGVGQRTDRPTQRRSTSEPASRAVVTARAQMEARAGSTETHSHFIGLASAYETPYEMYDFFGPYTEIVTAGAGAGSLARADLDVPLVLGHDSMRRIARTSTGTLQLSEDDGGLRVEAPELDMNDRDVSYIVPKIRAGLIDEMSFMFRITRGHWSPDYTEYRIDEYDIHRGDVAIVGFGANPYTVSDLRAAPQPVKDGRSLISLGDTQRLPLY